MLVSDISMLSYSVFTVYSWAFTEGSFRMAGLMSAFDNRPFES